MFTTPLVPIKLKEMTKNYEMEKNKNYIYNKKVNKRCKYIN